MPALAPTTSAARRPDIDWLRVLATYLLFAFHAGKVFDVPPFYHLKNAELSPRHGAVHRVRPLLAHAALLPAGGLVGGGLDPPARRGGLPARARVASVRAALLRHLAF